MLYLTLLLSGVFALHVSRNVSKISSAAVSNCFTADVYMWYDPTFMPMMAVKCEREHHTEECRDTCVGVTIQQNCYKKQVACQADKRIEGL